MSPTANERDRRPSAAALRIAASGHGAHRDGSTLPILLLVSVGIFGSARFQTWQVLTNAAREAPGSRSCQRLGRRAGSRVRQVSTWLRPAPDGRSRTRSHLNPRSRQLGTGTATASVVTVDYPFEFMVLQPLARLLVNGSTIGRPITIRASRRCATNRSKGRKTYGSDPRFHGVCAAITAGGALAYALITNAALPARTVRSRRCPSLSPPPTSTSAPSCGARHPPIDCPRTRCRQRLSDPKASSDAGSCCR